MTTPRPAEERFAEKVSFAGPDDCWLWTGSRTRKGYGALNGRRSEPAVRAHRLAWQLANGPIPDGLHVLHTCDNPPCVNPAHLWLGTNQDNVDDRERKGRNTHAFLPGDLSLSRSRPEILPRGEAHGMHKLTAPGVLEIRRRYPLGDVTRVQLAAEYGVGETAIANVLNGKTWRHLLPADWSGPQLLTLAQRTAHRTQWMLPAQRAALLGKRYRNHHQKVTTT